MLSDRPAVRLDWTLERCRRQLPTSRPRECRPRHVLARQQRHHHVAAHLHRGVRVGVQAQRLLHRCVQPPLRQRQLIACSALANWRRSGALLDLASDAVQKLLEVHLPRVHVELQRLARLQLCHQPLKRCRRLGLLLCGHQQRVRWHHPENPHERALARNYQSSTVDCFDRQQFAGLRHLPLALHGVHCVLCLHRLSPPPTGSRAPGRSCRRRRPTCRA